MALLFADNPLCTRRNLQEAVRELFVPLKAHFSPGCARVHLGDAHGLYPERAEELEAFARPLWGLAPLAAGGGDFADWELYRQGLIHGTDPEHPEYWGVIADYSQEIVEMAAVSYALALTPEQLWEPLDRSFGRSLTYRFAQGAFWGALAFAGVEALDWGMIKGLALRHLRWWATRPIARQDGCLMVSYAYPNAKTSETYNAPGSPYWALKFFLPLALPETHPFWQAEEIPLPELSAKHLQPLAGMIVCMSQWRPGSSASRPGMCASTVYARPGGLSVPRVALPSLPVRWA